MPTDRSGLWILTPDQCRQRLANHRPRIGRIALVEDGYPITLPVNYCLDQDVVTFRTHAGSALHAAAVAGAPVSFEVDEVDEVWQEGWSVLVKGRLQDITARTPPDRLRLLPLRSWAPGDKSRYIRVLADELVGRQIQ